MKQETLSKGEIVIYTSSDGKITLHIFQFVLHF